MSPLVPIVVGATMLASAAGAARAAASEEVRGSSADRAQQAVPPLSGPSSARRPVRRLLDFNDGSGTRLAGWRWSANANGYGAEGWQLVSTPELGAGEDFSWGAGPRMFNKTDYGAANKGVIDDSTRAPSTSRGGSLKVFDPPGSTDNQATWWIWYDGKNLGQRGIADAATDRMSFYLKIAGMAPIPKDGGSKSVGANFHIGTYLCWNRPDVKAYGSGDGCPYEGPGNQHYYHHLAVDPGAWVHVLLDRHPQHRRGVKDRVANDPSFLESGKHYFEHLNQMYMEIRAKQAGPTVMHIDEIEFYRSGDSGEASQNDESVASLWVGYWSGEDEWRLGFCDMSFPMLNDASVGTYEIRWSLQPITNANFAAAEPVTPLLYSGPHYVTKAQGRGGYFRRGNSWSVDAFTTFRLPRNRIAGAKMIHFAVKDVSRAGAHAGQRWPWNRGDGHDAPNDFVKTIDYSLGLADSTAR